MRVFLSNRNDLQVVNDFDVARLMAEYELQTLASKINAIAVVILQRETQHGSQCFTSQRWNV